MLLRRLVQPLRKLVDSLNAPLFGVGLRSPHYSFVLDHRPTTVDWFEVISENFMDTRGRPLDTLLRVREHYPIALHGVGMSIARSTGLNLDYLKRLKVLIERVQPFLVTDHICLTGTANLNSHDLLPFPYNQETLGIVVANVQHAQETLGRAMLFENPSVYMTFQNSDMPETEFLIEVCRRAGCRLLLDVNNVFVNARNFQFDPQQYLRAIPNELIGQVHVAGHCDQGEFLFDTHDHPVRPEVWNLLAAIGRRVPAAPVLLERDGNIPDFPEIVAELTKARRVFAGRRESANHEARI